MAPHSNEVIVEREPKLGGRGPDLIEPPKRFGGGGGGGDDGDAPGFRNRLRRYRLGVMIGLAAVVMFFVAFTSAYVVRQGLGTWNPATNSYDSDWRPLTIPGILWINTGLLLLSSVTLELARRRTIGRAAVAQSFGIDNEQRSVPWLGLTLVLGAGFIAGQWLAWRELASQGVFIATNPSSSFFYVLTGSHAVHLAGGLLALLYASAMTLLARPLVTKAIVVDVTSWYWHFMGFLWLYIFALLQLWK